MEEWKDIIGYEGLYQISNLGNVKNVKSQRILKGCTTKKVLYQYINLYKDSIKKTHRIHQLVASAFLTNPDNLPQIDHIDRNKLNNKVSNLRYVSRSDNQINKGLINSTTGEKNISYNNIRKEYSFSLRRNNKIIIAKWFKTKEEAIEYKEKYFSELNKK